MTTVVVNLSLSTENCLNCETAKMSNYELLRRTNISKFLRVKFFYRIVDFYKLETITLEWFNLDNFWGFVSWEFVTLLKLLGHPSMVQNL